MNEAESIIEKIRALLRLAKSDNAHEAALALQRAVEIANKHRIDLSQIGPDDDLRKLTHDHLETPLRLAQEYKEALNIAHGFFNVHLTVRVGTGKCLVVGTKLDIELASYVVTFLVRSCRACLAVWKAKERAAKRKASGMKVRSFIQGFFYGIMSNLMKQRQSAQQAHDGYALALSDEAAQRKALSRGLLSGKVTTLDMPDGRTDRRSQFQGFLQGEQTKINPGLRGNNTTLALT